MLSRNQKGARAQVVAMVAMCAVVATQIGCGEAVAPTPPTIVIDNHTTIFIGGTPQATPSPGSAAGATVTVTVNGFDDGELCPAGIEKANATKTVRLGCSLAVTVNPRDAQGRVIRDTSVTGIAPDYFLQRDDKSAAVFTQDGGNLYNGMVRTKAAGTFILAAAVKGIPSGDTVFTVVN